MIFLKIGNYTNKGDGLMLHAIVNRLSKSEKLVSLTRLASYENRARLGLYQAWWFQSLTPAKNRLIADLLPSIFKTKYGIVTEKEITAFMDASGFAYGDQWGEKNTKYTADLVEHFKKKGGKTILLPQSLGSFKDEKVKNQFLRIVKNTDLIFARDRSSYEFAQEAAGGAEHIKLAPDFTGDLKGINSGFDPDSRRACIIPNHRMIDSTDDKIGPAYLPFLKNAFLIFEELGLKPFVLVHEKVDHEVAIKLQKLLNKNIEVIQNDHPLILRDVISKCHIVLSSRFHGLVSTLSQVVPCIGTRWSHKFERLMEEYQCQDYLLSPIVSTDELKKKITELNEGPVREVVIKNIKQTRDLHSELNDQMWKEIETLINS